MKNVLAKAGCAWIGVVFLGATAIALYGGNVLYQTGDTVVAPWLALGGLGILFRAAAVALIPGLILLGIAAILKAPPGRQRRVVAVMVVCFFALASLPFFAVFLLNDDTKKARREAKAEKALAIEFLANDPDFVRATGGGAEVGIARTSMNGDGVIQQLYLHGSGTHDVSVVMDVVHTNGSVRFVIACMEGPSTADPERKCD